MRLTHISLTARDPDRLATFYRQVFAATPLRPRKTLSGPAVARGNGLPGVAITSIWLALPESGGPFLEILGYSEVVDRPRPRVNDPGFGHLAFAVPDIRTSMAAIVEAGGSAQGEITDFGRAEAPILLVYMRDPEGNLLELEECRPAP